MKRLTSWGYDDWDAFKEAGDYTLEVFETLKEMKPHLSPELYRMVTQAMEGPEIEELDI